MATEPSDGKTHATSVKLLLNGPVLRLLPATVRVLGGIPAAMIWAQIGFLTGASNKTKTPKSAVRLSYGRLHRMMPFLCRRTLISAVRQLEQISALKVERDGGVNRLAVVGDFAFPDDMTDLPYLMVQPHLADKIGLPEAIVLQAVHFRSAPVAGKAAHTRYTLAGWRERNFPFWSEKTIARTFAKLVRSELLTPGKCRRYVAEGDEVYLGHSAVNTYTVNHARLSALFVDNPGLVNEQAIPEVVKAAANVVTKAKTTPSATAMKPAPEIKIARIPTIGFADHPFLKKSAPDL